MHGTGRQNSMENLIKTWLCAQKFDAESIEYEEVSWAVDELFYLAHDDHQKLLNIIVEILKIDSSSQVLNTLGAGVLEDVLVHNGDKCIDEIQMLAEGNVHFKTALSNAYLDKDDVSPNVFRILQKIKSS
jgi:hypothetical protein